MATKSGLFSFFFFLVICTSFEKPSFYFPFIDWMTTNFGVCVLYILLSVSALLASILQYSGPRFGIVFISGLSCGPSPYSEPR